MVLFLQMFETRRAIRRERVFRDRTNPFDSLEDTELYSRYRFRRNELLEMVHEIKPEIEHRTRRNEAVSAENQFLTALHFFFTSSTVLFTSMARALTAVAISIQTFFFFWFVFELLTIYLCFDETNQ